MLWREREHRWFKGHGHEGVPTWSGVQMQVHAVDGARGEVNGASDVV